MKELNINLTIAALTVGLACCITALAEGIAKESYKADRASITAEFQEARNACAAMAGKQKAICLGQAKDQEKVALAELGIHHQRSPGNEPLVRVSRAETMVAMQ